MTVQKFDKDKARIDLVPSILITEVANVLNFGAKKYSENGWRRGADWNRFYAATMRHLLAWNDGETYDEESGFNHLSHAITNMAFLLEYANSELGNDHRMAKFSSDILDKPIASLNLGESEAYPEVGTSSIPDNLSPPKEDLGVSMASLPKLKEDKKFEQDLVFGVLR